uniref:Nuclear envelope integral membrane protein 1 n=1 Tax=Clastoptera arizonana TaxID=38151 RepID=A0A1B6DEG5_9HEMI
MALVQFSLFFLFFLIVFNISHGLLHREHELIPGKTMSCCQYDPYKSQRNFPVIYCYKGSPKSLVKIWESAVLQMNISQDKYELYKGKTAREVLEEFESLRSYWSLNFLNWKSKDFKINPFNSTCFGIRTNEDYLITLNVIHLDYWRLIICVIGILIFYLAKELSGNSFFYYVGGISVGIFASFLVLVYIFSKMLPMQKPLILGVMITGWSLGIYLLQIVWGNLRMVAEMYPEFLMGYFAISGVSSFLVCYWKGPVTNPRSKNIIQWTIQGIGLALIFCSSNNQEAALSLDILLLIVYLTPISWVKRVLYYVFAQFMEGSSHINDDEILSYETESRKYIDEIMTDDSSED